MRALTIWKGQTIESLPVANGVIWICILSISMLLIGCRSEHLTHTGPLGVCDGLDARRMDFVTQRSAARIEMERDVELGRHSVPGETLDTVGEQEADAYVQRVRDRWHEEDARLARAVADVAATLVSKGCR